MAKKKGNEVPRTVRPVGTTPAPQKQQQAARQAATVEKNSFITKYAEQLIVAGIALVTYLCMRSGLDNQFTNWDDNGYLTNDPFIKDVSSAGISKIFSLGHPVDGAVMGNYHPLTILSYAIEYSYKGLEPFIYHFDSLIFHILTTIAVYIFAKLLTKSTVAAGITALLFGIHPMHVESVAWAAGRKDVIYGLFYVLSCISYLYYLRAVGNKKIGWYAGMLVMFVLSLLAKPVAVTLPVALFLIDYFEKRKPDYWLFLDKAPGFALSIFFGLLSVRAQQKFGAYDNLDITFTPIERLALGCYALCTYLWKAVWPVKLCNFYPYPGKPTGSLPSVYYSYVFGALALAGAFAWAFIKKNRIVVFGIAFFMVNIFLLLQFKPVGAAIVADRYSYIPYLGLFLMAGWGISLFFGNRQLQSKRYVVLAGFLVYCAVLGVMSNDRCKDWYDSITLWRDEVEKHPESPNAYNNLGAIYSDQLPGSKTPQERKKNYDSSMYYLNAAISIKPDFINSLICLGILERTNGEIDKAEQTLYKARAVDKKNAEVFLELGVIYSIKKQYDSGAYCFRNAIALKPFFPEAYSNYANFLDITNQPDSSLKEYAIAIEQNPDAYIPYLNRARIYTRQAKYPEAMKDFAKAIEKSPEMAEIFYSRSKCYLGMGNKALALADVKKSISLGYTQVDQAYYQSLQQ